MRLGESVEMQSLFALKHGALHRAGWSPKLRAKYGYYTPDDYYEQCVDTIVSDGARWLDVGGGHDLFPGNRGLAERLAQRCGHLVVVDPSANVHENAFAHERHQTLLEDYRGDAGFDVATMRMVVEHVANPPLFVGKLGRLVRPGGLAVVYTVHRYAPVTLASAITPTWFHCTVKRVIWGGEDRDTFPTVYKMNTRRILLELFGAAGFTETYFRTLDDCRTLARWKAAATAELILWRSLKVLRVHYPERCILGVYRKD